MNRKRSAPVSVRSRMMIEGMYLSFPNRQEPALHTDHRDDATTLIALQAKETQLCILHYILFLRLMEGKMKQLPGLLFYSVLRFLPGRWPGKKRKTRQKIFPVAAGDRAHRELLRSPE